MQTNGLDSRTVPKGHPLWCFDDFKPEVVYFISPFDTDAILKAHVWLNAPNQKDCQCVFIIQWFASDIEDVEPEVQRVILLLSGNEAQELELKVRPNTVYRIGRDAKSADDTAMGDVLMSPATITDGQITQTYYWMIG